MPLAGGHFLALLTRDFEKAGFKEALQGVLLAPNVEAALFQPAVIPMRAAVALS